jgi:hypothetical protein
VDAQRGLGTATAIVFLCSVPASGTEVIVLGFGFTRFC